MLKELVGYGSTDKAVYPVTSTGAVFDSNSTSLDSIIADLYAKIKDNAGNKGGGDNPGDNDNPSGGGSGTKGEKGDKGDKGDPGETYNYVPCFIYLHPEDNVVPKKPIGGSYNFTTKVLTPPAGWKTSYSSMSKPIYMSIGMACSKVGSSIEWSSPFIAFSDDTGKGDLPYEPTPESSYKTLFIYKHSYTQPDIPTGGSYDFNTQRIVLPDGGWQLTKDTLENPVYMSIGFCSKNKTDIEWSYPIVVADGNGLGPGKTPANDILTKTYVVVAYKTDTSSEGPATPSSSDGNVDFTASPYIITPPKGWSLDRTMAINDNVWCTIKVFHQTSNNDYDNSSTPWSKPVKANLANVTLTDDQFHLIANLVKVDATDITTNFDRWIAQGSNIQMIANKIAETADIYTVTAGKYTVNADFISQVANKAISASNFKQDVIKDASGKIVAQVTADESGLYSTIANNIVQEAVADKDNKGGIIYLVAKNVTNNIKSEIEVGTDDSGNGFIKAIANSIDFNSNAFNSIVTNATSGKVTTIMQTDDTISLIKKAANDTATSLIMGDDYIKMVAAQVNIAGSLNTIDLTINGSKSKFNADGSGYVANGNVSWNEDGNVSIKGKIIENTKQIELTPLNRLITDNDNIVFSNLAFIDATDPYTFYSVLNTRDKPNLLMPLLIKGYSLGATIRFTISNYTEGNKVVLCNLEEKEFRYKVTSSSNYTEKVFDSGTDSLRCIILGDGFYELVAIGNNKWMLTVGYGDSTIKEGMHFG